MRPILAFLVVVSILGGLQFYMSTRPISEDWQAPKEVAVAGAFELDVTLSFDAGPDAFALDASDAPSVLIQFRGVDLLRKTEPISAGEDLSVAISQVKLGKNEFFVRVTPAADVPAVSRAVRIRIRKDDLPIADQTLWCEPGEPVEGVITIDLAKPTAQES